MTNMNLYHRCESFIKAAYTLNEFVRINPDVFYNSNKPVERLIEGDHEYYLTRSKDKMELHCRSYPRSIKRIMIKTGPKAIGRLLEAYIQEIERKDEK